jgi:uncharacterized protein YceK
MARAVVTGTLAMAAIFAMSGCGTVSNIAFSLNPHYEYQIYGGVRNDVEVVWWGSLKELWKDSEKKTKAEALFDVACCTAFCTIDLPLCAALDTLTLPITIKSTLDGSAHFFPGLYNLTEPERNGTPALNEKPPPFDAEIPATWTTQNYLDRIQVGAPYAPVNTMLREHGFIPGPWKSSQHSCTMTFQRNGEPQVIAIVYNGRTGLITGKGLEEAGE